MPDWILGLFRAEVAAVLTVLLAVAFVARKMWPYLTGMQRFLDSWFGVEDRPGQPAQPGVLQRLSALEEINRNTQSDHGESAYDATMDRIAGIGAEVVDLRQIVAGVFEQQAISNDRVTYLLTELVRNHPESATPVDPWQGPAGAAAADPDPGAGPDGPAGPGPQRHPHHRPTEG